jgi:hypothetical protein
LITAYPSDDGVKVNFTVTVFDLEKAKPHYNKVVTALATLDNTEEVRLIFYKEKNALLFKDGKIYACKLLPAKGYEELTFVAQDVPVGTYYTYQEK